jgi:hypothetical protein
VKSKTKKSTAIRAALAAGDTDIKKLSKKYDVSLQYIYNLRSAMNKKYKTLGEAQGENLRKAIANTTTQIWEAVAPLNPDTVNHPPHYTAGKIEVIDFIEDQKLSYHLGNVVKYVCRADHKGSRLEDLKKAAWYLDREIEKSSKI